MSYTILHKPSAEHEIARLPRAMLTRVDVAIMRLKETPRSAGCIKLTGLDAYRVRVGDYRILYTIDDARQTVLIHAVRHRRDVYRGI